MIIAVFGPKITQPAEWASPQIRKTLFRYTMRQTRLGLCAASMAEALVVGYRHEKEKERQPGAQAFHRLTIKQGNNKGTSQGSHQTTSE